MMDKQGKIPESELKTDKIVSKDNTVIFTVESKKPVKKTVWVSFTLASLTGNMRTVSATPVDKSDQPLAQTTTLTVSDPTKPFTIPVEAAEADKVIITVTPATSEPSDAQVESAEACMYSDVTEDTTVLTTTMETTTSVTSQPETTTPVPESTTTVTPPTTETVPLICTAPLEPTECLCHRTCDHMSDLEECPPKGSSSCHRGCQCPAGTVMLNGTCIKETECPCFYNGKFYKYSDKIEVEGLHCVYMICTHEGMKRTTDQECNAPVVCTAGRTFQVCPCERTCHEDAHICDNTHCTPSCACPSDTVWNGEACVLPKQCTCKEGNVTYADGQSWDVGQCTNCHCVEGREMCAEICRVTEEECKKQGKKLFNKDLRDSVCCRCITEEPHCM
jgi:hypothetical protein